MEPETSPDRHRAPAPLLVAASIGAVQGLVLLLLAAAELASLSSERLALGQVPHGPGTRVDIDLPLG